jgi:molybdopterin converting factor small subunit
MVTKEEILRQFALFSAGTGGIDSWLSPQTPDDVFDRIGTIDKNPLSRVQLTQLLVLSHEAGPSDGFFHYYWLSVPDHAYNITSIPGYQPAWKNATSILSLEHLKWGLYRLYVDALLYFGNIRSGYRALREKTSEDLISFFKERRFDTNMIKRRGPPLQLRTIPKDHRYLISEMACKSYGPSLDGAGELKKALLDALKDHRQAAHGRVKIRELLDGSFAQRFFADRQQQLLFSADEILEEDVETIEELEQKYSRIAKIFFEAREAALKNTQYYLSMVDDLDVYVATSMRDRNDFRTMADSCEKIFADPLLKDMHLRYFDPTLSAAEGHEDKGLIECLMVKCAKALVYCAGKKESYGKDAEAAMALSQGKPVIFYCDEEQRSRFYRDIHPLSRLIDFNTGVAVGAFVTSSLSDVSRLLYLIFENKMEYELDQSKPGYLRLKDRVTNSVIRIQTNDTLLRETFWNYYHNRGTH